MMGHLTLKLIAFSQMEQLDADTTAFVLNLRDINIQPEHTTDSPCRVKIKYYSRKENWLNYKLNLKQCATAVQAWQDFMGYNNPIPIHLSYSLYRQSQCK